jgi:putative SOS response-associated peptidase YedK
VAASPDNTLGARWRRSTGSPIRRRRRTFNRTTTSAPTTTIDAVLEDGNRTLEQMRWGFVPGWWSEPLREMRLSTFNARAETVTAKPMFRSAFKRNRCLIPVSGYYEWKSTPTGKQPYYCTARDGSPLTIAGIWDEWKDEIGESLKSCTLIVTNANKLATKYTTGCRFCCRQRILTVGWQGRRAPNCQSQRPILICKCGLY